MNGSNPDKAGSKKEHSGWFRYRIAWVARITDITCEMRKF
jgi:hypothetical protein